MQTQITEINKIKNNKKELKTAALAPIISDHLRQTGIVKQVVNIKVGGIADKGINGSLLQIHYPDLEGFLLGQLSLLPEELDKRLQALAAGDEDDAVRAVLYAIVVDVQRSYARNSIGLRLPLLC